MLFPILFSFLLHNTDTAILSSAGCNMRVEQGTSLVVSEQKLLAISGEGKYAENQPTAKIIKDTISNQYFRLDEAEGWLNAKNTSHASVNHIGSNKVILSVKGNNIYMVVEPDKCNCKWTSTFRKTMLPFVKKSLEHLVFSEIN